LSIDLIKLAIQRCADGSKIIIEGDSYAQVDKKSFEGHNNGLQRVIEVFTGTDAVDFGYVNLPIIYRSKMGDKAEEL
jgi:predicted ribonuclease YlaK